MKKLILFVILLLMFSCTDYKFRDPFESSQFIWGWDYYKTYEFNTAIQIFSDDVETGIKLAENFSGLGWSYLHLNDVTKSLIYFENSLQNNDAYADSYTGAAFAYMLSEQPDSVVTALENALEAEPQFRVPDTHYEIDMLSNKDVKKMLAVHHFITGDFVSCAEIVNVSGQALPTRNEDYDNDSWNLLLDLMNQYE